MNILDFVMVGSNDYEKSSEFYDVILEPLKLKKTLKPFSFSVPPGHTPGLIGL